MLLECELRVNWSYLGCVYAWSKKYRRIKKLLILYSNYRSYLLIGRNFFTKVFLKKRGATNLLDIPVKLAEVIQKCGISNAMDGTEDEVLYEDLIALEKTENEDIDTIASSSRITENENKDEHIITGISDNELNDYYHMAIGNNTISDEQLRRMFGSDGNVVIVEFRVTAKMIQYL